MNSTYNINNLTTSEAAFAGGLFGSIMIGALVYAIFIIIAFWRIFEKAGVKGWKSLIPIYNFYCALKIVGMSPLWILWIVLVTIVQSVVFTMALGDNANAYYSGKIGLPEEVVTNAWVIITTIIMFVVTLYVSIAYNVRLAKAFHKGVIFTVGLILLSGIFTLILGFGSAKYDKKILKA